ncbi:Ig-like domain-containing protein, partial [Microcoleus sp. Pol8_D1]
MVGNDNTGLFTLPPAIDSLGQLIFTSPGAAICRANISLNLRNKSGIANGGIDTSATHTFVINVTNQQPVAQPDSYSIPHDKVFSLLAPGVLANDDNPDGDPLTAKLVSSPNNGKVVFNSNGSFSYTPNPGFAGLDNFTYSVSDGV